MVAPNISTSKVSSYSKILENLFSENYVNVDKIQITSLHMRGKAKEWWVQMKKKLEGVTTWAKQLALQVLRNK
jgi:hypothetical protein